MSTSNAPLAPMQDTSVYSNYLKEKFDVKVFPAEHDPLIKVISHDSLKNLLYNVLVVKYPDLNIKFETKLEFAKETGPNPGDGHFVYSFTIWDIRGRKVTEIGESVPATLESIIARNIPAMTAFHRAMDRAIISYVDFEGKAFSTEEGVAYNKNATYGPAPQQAELPVPVASEKAAPVGKQPQASTRTTSVSNFSDKASSGSASRSAQQTSKQTGKTTSPAKGVTSANKPIKYVGENMKINFPTSKHKDKTIDATWQEDTGYIEWIAGNGFKPTSDSAQKLKDAALACIAFYRKGGNKQ